LITELVLAPARAVTTLLPFELTSTANFPTGISGFTAE
jgi:hypothetical protein